jgi:hypothetical protein
MRLEIERNDEMTTTRQARHSRFQRGSGVFNCAVCGRSTRVTTQDNDNLCAECYDLAGETNALSDTGELFDKNAVDLLNRCVERGGSVEKLLREFPEVCEHVGWTGPAPKGSITAKEWAERTATDEDEPIKFTAFLSAPDGFSAELNYTGDRREVTMKARQWAKDTGNSRKHGTIRFRVRKA